MVGMKTTHLVLWVQENKTSEKFYKKIGFEVRESDDEHSVVSPGSGFSLDLVSMRDETKFSKDSMAAEKGLGMYIYVSVEDVDQKYQELVSLGLEPTKPKDWPWGNREFIFKDPDGYKLCFWRKSV